MSVVNADVAALFNEIADLLEVEDANVFRVRAYRNAAQMVGELTRSVAGMVERGEDLDALPGIGPDLAAKIAEIVRTGRCALLDQLHREVPAAVSDLLRVPGLGPKRVGALYRQLGVRTLAQLRHAAETGRISQVHGFGLKTQQRILESISTRLSEDHRTRLSDARQTAEALLQQLRALPGVLRAETAGSLRRCRDTVGDLDLLVAIRRGSPVMRRFVSLPDVRTILSQGSTRASVILRSGLQVDLRAVSAPSFATAWLYFTGSKAHNIALRRLAQAAGLKLNEYGAYRGARRLATDSEQAVYGLLGLPYIEPELREDRGEIEAAQAGRLPRLIDRADLRGDLHAHTRDSDGHDSLETMAEAARVLGLAYLAITEHSRHLGVTHGLDAQGLARQIDRIDELNTRLQGITLLKGVEVDILEDGRLDLPDSVLARLDLVVGAVHQGFHLSRERQTDRLLRAMDHRHFSILAHPTGRLLGERPAMEVDLARVIHHARARGCFLELNAHPSRLDLDDTACRMARDEGVLVSINSDAHSTLELDHLRDGVAQARRGWLSAADVLNSRPLQEVLALLRATMGHPAVTARPQAKPRHPASSTPRPAP